MRRTSLHAIFSVLAITATLFLTSCRFDDDSAYTPQTAESYFLVQTPSGDKSITQRLADGTIVTSWNSQFGISDADLSDFVAENHSLWMANRSSKQIIEVDLRSGKVSHTLGLGTLVPDYLSMGREYVLVSDSAGLKLGFVKWKKGKVETLNTPHSPSLSVYHSGRFYIKMDSLWLSVWNELAATEEVAYLLDHPIREIQFDAQYYVHVISSDTSGRYASSLDNNSTLLLQDEVPIASTEERYSPWLRSLYETEYLKNIFLTGGVLDTPGYPDSTSAFEVDFFEGKVFLFDNDSMRVRDLNLGTMSGAVAFVGTPIKVWHHIDARGK